MNPEQVGSFIMVDTLGIRLPHVDVTKFPFSDTVLTASGEHRRGYRGKRAVANDHGVLHFTTYKTTKCCDIEGSISLQEQKHNIVSTSNVPLLAYHMIQKANRAFELGLGYDRAAFFARGLGCDVVRIDTPVLLRKPTGYDTAALVNGLAVAGIAAGVNVSVYAHESVYFDQHSQLRAVKVYDTIAASESKRNRPEIPESLAKKPLIKLGADTLRMEAVYRKKWLKRRYKEDCTPSRFTPTELGAMLL
jgi:hypothetical protein